MISWEQSKKLTTLGGFILTVCCLFVCLICDEHFYPSKLFGHSFLSWKTLLHKLHIFRMMSICYRRQMAVQVSGSNTHKAYTLFIRGLKWRSLDLVDTLAHITKHLLKDEWNVIGLISFPQKTQLHWGLYPNILSY